MLSGLMELISATDLSFSLFPPKLRHSMLDSLPPPSDARPSFVTELSSLSVDKYSKRDLKLLADLRLPKP